MAQGDFSNGQSRELYMNRFVEGYLWRTVSVKISSSGSGDVSTKASPDLPVCIHSLCQAPLFGYEKLLRSNCVHHYAPILTCGGGIHSTGALDKNPCLPPRGIDREQKSSFDGCLSTFGRRSKVAISIFGCKGERWKAATVHDAQLRDRI